MIPHLTLNQLIEALTQLKIDNPDYSDKPVHILDMEDDGHHLITHVEVDKFTDEQGWVTSLMSWPTELYKLRVDPSATHATSYSSDGHKSHE